MKGAVLTTETMCSLWAGVLTLHHCPSVNWVPSKITSIEGISLI